MKHYNRILVLISFLAAFYVANNICAENWTIEIKRASYNSSSITGELFVNGKFLCHTLELPWLNNESFVSAIPADTYDAILRYHQKDAWRLQLKDVPGRTGIQIHIGNTPKQSSGCVLVGEVVNNQGNALGGGTSAPAYKALKKMFYGTDNPKTTPDHNVKVKISCFPGRTKFFSKDFEFVYQDCGQWKASIGGERLTFREEYRDMKHIYTSCKVTGGIGYFRIPLFGGRMEEGTSITGPWMSSNGSKVTRNN